MQVEPGSDRRSRARLRAGSFRWPETEGRNEMNREAEDSSSRAARRGAQGRRRDLRGRLPRDQRAPGRRAARRACARPTPASASSRTASPCGPPTRRAPTAIKDFLDGPTALTLVEGDVALAAKTISELGGEWELLAYKGGIMDGEVLEPDQFTAIARCPDATQLNAQFAGIVASPLTGLVRGLGSMIPASPASSSRSPSRAWSAARPPPRPRSRPRPRTPPPPRSPCRTRAERVARGGALRGAGARGRGGRARSRRRRDRRGRPGPGRGTRRGRRADRAPSEDSAEDETSDEASGEQSDGNEADEQSDETKEDGE